MILSIVFILSKLKAAASGLIKTGFNTFAEMLFATFGKCSWVRPTRVVAEMAGVDRASVIQVQLPPDFLGPVGLARSG